MSNRVLILLLFNLKQVRQEHQVNYGVVLLALINKERTAITSLNQP